MNTINVFGNAHAISDVCLLGRCAT